MAACSSFSLKSAQQHTPAQPLSRCERGMKYHGNGRCSDSDGVLSSDLHHRTRLERAQSRVPTARSADDLGI